MSDYVFPPSSPPVRFDIKARLCKCGRELKARFNAYQFEWTSNCACGCGSVVADVVLSQSKCPEGIKT